MIFGRKKKYRRESDVIWTTVERKVRAVAGAAGERLAAGGRVIVAAHFSDTLLKLEVALKTNAVPLRIEGGVFHATDLAAADRDPGAT